jgi:UDP-2,3-diacylglucosamine hydrolase
MLKKIFRNPICKKLFSIIPPTLGIGLANYSSQGSRSITGNSDEIFLGEEKEWLIQFCREELNHSPIDYFIFGHRHLPLDYQLNDNSRYINLGDWINYFSYAVFDGNELKLNYYKE